MSKCVIWNNFESENEDYESDVEMQDISFDFLNELSQKEETVFDATACFYIVVDTNVLIGSLDLINELKDTALDGKGPPHIFIPWVVIEELDIKKSQTNSKATADARKVIRYLNTVLGKHPRIHGQLPSEAEAWAKTYSRINDNKVLECCMGLSNKIPAEKVILFTNDKKFISKALILKINVENVESMRMKMKRGAKFNWEKMKGAKKREREEETAMEISFYEIEVKKEPKQRQFATEERKLRSKRDKCKCEISKIMSNVQQLLKDILEKKLSEDTVRHENVRYWRTVFHELAVKYKKNIELLLEKAKRPEGFCDDKNDFIETLSSVKDLFHQMKQKTPKLNVPVEVIEKYCIACDNAFDIYCESQREFRLAEDKSVHKVLDENWLAINQLCGIIMDHYGIPHNFGCSLTVKLPEIEIQRILAIVYQVVKQIKRLLFEIFNGVKSAQPVKKTQVRKLYRTLLDFIPSLKLPCEPKSYPFFNTAVLEKWLKSQQNRQSLEIGIVQIDNFFSKLEEAVKKDLEHA